MEAGIGIKGYLTTTPGLGGTLKKSAEDFVVEEIPLPPASEDHGSFAIAKVRTRDWETNRLVRQLARALRISRRRIGFAGTKDKRAVTTQLFSFADVTPDQLQTLRIRDVEVLEAFRANRPLEIGDLIGNRFQIVLRDLRTSPGEAATVAGETTRQVEAAGGFPNFFGIQRFGSVRPITHVVGRHLVRGRFREAVETYAANPIEGEDETSFEVRAALEETGDVKQALRTYPRSYTFEKAMLNHLNTHPGDYLGALQALPPNLLLLFVHAYQSYLFNRMISERLRRGLPLNEPVLGDLVLPPDVRGLPDRERTVEVTEDNEARAADRCRSGRGWVSAVLFGSESTFAGGPMGEIERAIVEEEGLRPEDFLIPALPRTSSRGTRREVLAPVKDLRARTLDDGLHVSVELSRGAYATCLLREYSKIP